MNIFILSTHISQYLYLFILLYILIVFLKQQSDEIYLFKQ